MLPTIVLVHGAFAESASWDGVVDPLRAAGHDVVAAANPLRGLASDAQSVSDVVRAVDGPVVLVAHSYGGAVLTNVDPDAGEIVGLVYVNGFAPEPGDSCFGLAGMFPGSMVGEATVRPVPLSDGTTDLYIARNSFHDERAGARRTVELAGASHAAAVSQPGAVTELILEAARQPAAA
jgi:pimeloyl-ACP methyl ester carboxylesterase